MGQFPLFCLFEGVTLSIIPKGVKYSMNLVEGVKPSICNRILRLWGRKGPRQKIKFGLFKRYFYALSEAFY